MRKLGVLLASLVIFLGSSALALGFSVRGAVRYDFGPGRFGAEGEVEYADKLGANLTWGVRASVRAIPFGGDLVVIVPNLFAEYRTPLLEEAGTTVSGYGLAELGVGLSPQFFPRAVLTAGVDARTGLGGGLDGFAQAKLSFESVITNRAILSAEARVGAIVIPFVPFVGLGYGYNFYGGVSLPKAFAGSLMYLSPQMFVGLEGGLDPGGYVRVFFQWSER